MELTLEMIIRFGPRAEYRWRYEERATMDVFCKHIANNMV